MSKRRQIERHAAAPRDAKLQALKSRAYDLISYLERIQQELRAVNAEIARLSGPQEPAPPPPPKERDAEPEKPN